jgi:crotonobetainyl-CoA:carnitine CoA-transferase CaiB-like acyl-CoA transferase
MEIGDSLAVAYCGLQFSLWGAEVMFSNRHAKALQQLAPSSGGQSLTWAYLSANKTGVDDLQDLVQTADIVLTNYSQAELKEFGIALADRTVVQEIHPFASNGLLSGLPEIPLLIEAESGSLIINGSPNRAPARAPANMVAYLAGVSAFGAALAAYHKYLVSGEAEVIETSSLDVMATISPVVRSQYTGGAFDKRDSGPFTGVRLYTIGDSIISANLSAEANFQTVLELLEIAPEEVPDHLHTPKGRQNIAALNKFLKEKSEGKRNVAALFRDMMANGRAGLYLEPGQLPDHEQLQALSFFRELSLPDGKTVPYPGLPATCGQMLPPSPKPAHIDSKAPWQGKQIEPVPRAQRGARPLEGVRIVDLTHAWIGPHASKILADLGADVIKIESHRRPDVWRSVFNVFNTPESGPENSDAHPFNLSGNFNGTNRNKRGIALDLKREEGVRIARELIATADVVMNNYTPGVMEKFGLDYDSLRSVNEDIISVAWSGYGTQGPYAPFKALATTIESLAGWDALFGYHDSEPMVMGFYQADAITGLQMAACTLLALLQRDLTGEGQQVDGSMLAAAVPYIGEEVLNASLGNETIRWGNRHPHMVPHGVFRCSGDDHWVALACPDDGAWKRLQQLVGIDGKLDSLALRREREDDIESSVAEWTAGQTREEAETALREAGVPAVAVITVLESIEHPEFTSRNWFQRQSHPDMGEHAYVGFPWRFSHSTLRADRPAPRLGENTEEILQMLGYDAAEIASLFDEHIVGAVFAKRHKEKAKN